MSKNVDSTKKAEITMRMSEFEIASDAGCAHCRKAGANRA
jgi:hypothetical protein